MDSQLIASLLSDWERNRMASFGKYSRDIVILLIQEWAPYVTLSDLFHNVKKHSLLIILSQKILQGFCDPTKLAWEDF